MIACVLIGAAALAVGWPTPLTAGGSTPVRSALRTAKPATPTKLSEQTKLARQAKAARLAKAAKAAQAAKAARIVAAALPTTKALSATAIKIAVVDTGVAPVSTLASRLVPGADFVDAAGTTLDHNGHGTAMASIADAVCAACAIVPIRALGDSGTGTTDVAAEGVRWATANGARVINLSLTSSAADDGLTAAIETAVASGVVVVIAAGNSGSTDPAAQGYPGAAAADAITVASVDSARQLYPWSNHGSWVHLAAPGTLGALAPNGKAMSATGTSASAAYVSGAAGLLLTCNPALTPAQVRSALLGSATPIAAIGGGVVNPAAAVAASTPPGGCAH